MFYSLRLLVQERADERCEYCRRYMELFGAVFFEIERIVPRSKGGPTILENLVSFLF